MQCSTLSRVLLLSCYINSPGGALRPILFHIISLPVAPPPSRLSREGSFIKPGTYHNGVQSHHILFGPHFKTQPLWGKYLHRTDKQIIPSTWLVNPPMLSSALADWLHAHSIATTSTSSGWHGCRQLAWKRAFLTFILFLDSNKVGFGR